MCQILAGKIWRWFKDVRNLPQHTHYSTYFIHPAHRLWVAGIRTSPLRVAGKYCPSWRRSLWRLMRRADTGLEWAFVVFCEILLSLVKGCYWCPLKSLVWSADNCFMRCAAIFRMGVRLRVCIGWGVHLRALFFLIEMAGVRVETSLVEYLF